MTKRFFGSLRRHGLDDGDAKWVDDHLLPSESELWARMSRADQRHACAVARKVVSLLDADATRPVVAAALLHDVGKIETNPGTFARVLATLAGQMATREQIESWSHEKGWLGRAGRYLMHNEIGAEMLKRVGSDPITVTWAREHELKHTEWTLPENITDALWKADNS